MIRVFLLALLMFISCGKNLHAAEPNSFDLSAFRALPVLHEGRVKPLDSFARLHLRQFSGRETLPGGMDANTWLAEALFDPASALERPVFLVADPQIREFFALEPQQKYFSAQELAPAISNASDVLQPLLEQDEAFLTPEQTAILGLYRNTHIYNDILRSFSAFLPLDLEIPEKYKSRLKNEARYIDLQKLQIEIAADLHRLTKSKGDKYDSYTEEEKKLSTLAFIAARVHIDAQGLTLLKILPDANNVWHSPWEFTLRKNEINPYLALWLTMAASYRNGEPDSFARNAASALSHIKPAAPAALNLEIWKNALHPLMWAMLAYALATAFFFMRLRTRHTALAKLSTFSLLTGIIIHAAELTMRVVILARPPVGTLYESVLFVSWICALIALLINRKHAHPYALPAGSVAALGLLLLAPTLIRNGENMETLVAVLNTNFWLATHVLCITAGYGACILAACLAHLWLALKPRLSAAALLPTLQQKTYEISLLALLLTATGTVLGGIWADQSWGRFWGWDPKENGALLIVLWLLWLQHGRIAQHLDTKAFMVGTAALNIIVALAWFGVNLLNTGLHSYGFTTGLATALALFCGTEILALAVLWFLARRHA